MLKHQYLDQLVQYQFITEVSFKSQFPAIYESRNLVWGYSRCGFGNLISKKILLDQSTCLQALEHNFESTLYFAVETYRKTNQTLRQPHFFLLLFRYFR